MKIFNFVKAAFITLPFFLFSFPAGAGEVQKDVWGATVPSAFMIYIVAPDRLAGWPAPFYEYEEKFIPEKYKKLPVLGGWHNGGGIPDKEMMMKMKVKRAFIISSENHSPATMDSELKKMGMDVFVMKGITLTDNIAMFRELGKELGLVERGKELAKYAENALAKSEAMLEGLKEEDKPRVYIAGWTAGLTTDCNSEVLNLAGGRNVYDCSDQGHGATRLVSFEQIVAFDPDVILITDPRFGYKYKEDPKWRRLRAYKNNKILVAPYGPFGWMDKPAAMKFMAVQWLTCNLHPDRCALDIPAESKKFMKLFMHVDLGDAQISEILKQ